MKFVGHFAPRTSTLTHLAFLEHFNQGFFFWYLVSKFYPFFLKRLFYLYLFVFKVLDFNFKKFGINACLGETKTNLI